jgi:hypothetical protein
MSPLPIEDPAGLEERRRAIGVGPLEADIWLREVGWRH